MATQFKMKTMKWYHICMWGGTYVNIHIFYRSGFLLVCLGHHQVIDVVSSMCTEKAFGLFRASWFWQPPWPHPPKIKSLSSLIRVVEWPCLPVGGVPSTLGRLHTIWSVSSCRTSALYLGQAPCLSSEQPPKTSKRPSGVRLIVWPNRGDGANPLIFGWIQAKESVLKIQKSLKATDPFHPPWTTIFRPTSSAAWLNL
jgi:hypothetical protein